MAWRLDVKEMVEQAKIAPRTGYRILVLSRGEWQQWPIGQRRAGYAREQSAKEIAKAVRATPDIDDVMICREDTVFYSDIQTKALMSITNYTGMLV